MRAALSTLLVGLVLAGCATGGYKQADLQRFQGDAAGLACAISGNRFTADPDETFDIVHFDARRAILSVPELGERAVSLSRLRFCFTLPQMGLGASGRFQVDAGGQNAL